MVGVHPLALGIVAEHNPRARARRTDGAGAWADINERHFSARLPRQVPHAQQQVGRGRFGGDGVALTRRATGKAGTHHPQQPTTDSKQEDGKTSFHVFSERVGIE